ncbi:MAG: YARHG domain-containing protein [Bacteroidota bacterium]
MKNIVALLFLCFFVAGCNKLIKNESPVLESEQASQSAQAQLKRKNNKKPTDMIGFWVGSFNATEGFVNQQITDKGTLAWHKEKKITLAIESITIDRVDGYSVIAGITHKCSGIMKENEDFIEFELTELGRDPQIGTFYLKIDKKDTVLKGGWTAKKKGGIETRYCNFTKQHFEYNPNVTFALIQGISEDQSIKDNVHYPGEYDEWYSAITSNYDIVQRLNPSTKTLTDSEVSGLTKSELMLLRNTIFARHGYAFKKRPLRIYFEQQPWYIPVSSNPKSGLTKTENQNIALIVSYERYFGEYDGNFGR